MLHEEVSMDKLLDPSKNDERTTTAKIESALLQTIVKDLKSKHEAEKHALLCELQVFKKVVHFMSAKIRDL
jgi:hypothetical protein